MTAQLSTATTTELMTSDNLNISFVVTGFGPFNGVPSNPTTVIVETLVSFLTEQANHNTTNDNDNNTAESSRGMVYSRLANTTRTVVLETSVEDVKRQLDRLELETKERQRDNTNDTPTTTMTVYLHLGVDDGAKQFQLESCAYNNADFRVPDEAGYQPQQERIWPNQELEAPLETTLNVPELVQTMNQTMMVMEQEKELEEDTDATETQKLCVVSTNPGRFVCNYIYCRSLQQFQSCRRSGPDDKDSNCDSTTDKDSSTSTSSSCKSLFLHVPPFEQIPESEQLQFVAQLMVALCQQLNEEAQGQKVQNI